MYKYRSIIQTTTVPNWGKPFSPIVFCAFVGTVLSLYFQRYRLISKAHLKSGQNPYPVGRVPYSSHPLFFYFNIKTKTMHKK